MNSPVNPTFLIETLGCKVNQYESQAMREELKKNGFLEKKDAASADFYILNSCTVTQKADADTRNLIRRFHRTNPSGKVVIAGCYAEFAKDRKALMDIPGVARLVRNTEKDRIAEIVAGQKSPAGRENRLNITNFENRDRAFVKVQDGCNHRCAYCKVPLVRGPSRSRPEHEIVSEITVLASKGYKEIVLTGICLGAWGKDPGEKSDLAYLVRHISRIDGLFRVRLSSIEPIYVTDDIISLLKENTKVCKHLHIPLQSGDDRILRLMKRPYTGKKFREIIRKIRKQIPDIAVTTDVLVGFPGESERNFRNTLKFIKEIKFSRIHVFSYSSREGTAAAERKAGPDKKAVKKRVKILRDAGKKLSMDFAKHFIGKSQSVVIESHRDKSGFLGGYTDRYIRVFIDGPDPLKNKLIPVEIIRVDEHLTTALPTA